MGWWRKKKSKKLDEKQRLFHENGKVVLEKVIEYCNGKSNPIKSFSASQILRATDNFSQNNALFRSRPSSYQCYKESIICRPRNGPLYLYDFNLPWNLRMKIAKEVADALTYLHTAFSKSIIHKDMVPCKIFLDEKGTAKLSEFDNSVLIPEGEKFVEDIIEGTFGYLDYNYMYTGRVTENTDVYGFGAFMLTLLTAMNPSLVDQLYKEPLIKLVEDFRFVEISDPMVLESCKEQEIFQMKDFFVLSLRCIGCLREVPTMIEVAKELKKMLVQANL